MKNLYLPTLFVSSLTVLSACGGGGSGSEVQAVNTPPEVIEPVLTVSPTSLTFSGKQLAPSPPEQVLSFSFSETVDRVSANFINASGDSIFSSGVSLGPRTVVVNVNSTDLEGGTFTDDLVLTPSLVAGGDGQPVTVPVTLIQEPTVPISIEPEFVSVAITPDGPPVSAGVIFLNAGNTISWTTVPFRFVADDMDAVFAVPAEGIGSQEIEIFVNPTPSLISSIDPSQPDGAFADLGFQDVDAIFNLATLELSVTLGE